MTDEELINQGIWHGHNAFAHFKDHGMDKGVIQTLSRARSYYDEVIRRNRTK